MRAKITKPGYVWVDTKELPCGIRLLTESESKDGFPFDSKELAQIVSNPNSLPGFSSSRDNIKALAVNFVNFHTTTSRVQDFPDTHKHKSETVEKLLADKRPPAIQPLVVFTRGDIIDRAQKLSVLYPEQKIALLNPANRRFVGGGAFVGANALEEIYFRCSSLGLAYAKHAWEEGFHYEDVGNQARPAYDVEMGIGESWFTENIQFFYKPEGQTYVLLEKPFSVGVIGSTAPNYANKDQAKDDTYNEAIIKEEIRAQLTAAYKHGVTIPLLTAFGCGAFNNIPEAVARYYWEVLYLEGYTHLFEHVEFAIWQDPNPQAAQNFSAFVTTFEKLTHNHKDQLNLWIVNNDETPQLKVMKYHNNFMAGLAEGNPEKYLTIDQKKWKPVITECQESVKVYANQDHFKEVDMRFNKPGSFPLSDYFTPALLQTQGIHLPVVADTEVYKKLAEKGLLAPEFNEPGLDQARANTKHRVIYSQVPFMTKNGLQIRKMITACAPNFMGTSPADKAKYLTKEGKLNAVEYAKSCNELATLIIYAAKENKMDPFDIAEFGLGVYLKVFKENPEQARIARHCMYTAFASAAKHYNLRINWMLFEGSKGEYRKTEQEKANRLNEQLHFSHMTFVVGNVLNSACSLNNGSDRTIGGKANVNFATSKHKTMTTEEQVAQHSLLLEVQSELNPHLTKDPYGMKKEDSSLNKPLELEIRPMREMMAEGVPGKENQRLVRISFPCQAYAEIFAKDLLTKHGIHTFKNPAAPVNVHLLEDGSYFIHLGAKDYDTMKGNTQAFVNLLTAGEFIIFDEDIDNKVPMKSPSATPGSLFNAPNLPLQHAINTAMEVLNDYLAPKKNIDDTGTKRAKAYQCMLNPANTKMPLPFKALVLHSLINPNTGGLAGMSSKAKGSGLVDKLTKKLDKTSVQEVQKAVNALLRQADYRGMTPDQLTKWENNIIAAANNPTATLTKPHVDFLDIHALSEFSGTAFQAPRK